jgi:hypothetical protein
VSSIFGRRDDRVLRVMLGVALLVWSVLAVAMMNLRADTGLHADPLRILVVGGYLLVGPGLAVALLLALRDRLLSAVVAVLFSFSALVLLAQASLYSGWWRPGAVIAVLVGLTAVFALVALVRDLRGLRASRAGERGAA